jgi:hypothetical protein
MTFYGFSKFFPVIVNDIEVIRPILEYGAEIWNGGLTQEQKKSIERIKKRVLRIIYPNLDYDQAITETKLQTLEERRDELCICLIKKMLEPNHKLRTVIDKTRNNLRITFEELERERVMLG